MRLNLLVRTVSKRDRRVSLLSTSRKGRQLVAKYEKRKASMLAPVLAKFKPEELDTFSRMLERFAVHLFQEQAPEEGLCLRCAAYVDDHCPVGRLHNSCPYHQGREKRLPAL